MALIWTAIAGIVAILIGAVGLMTYGQTSDVGRIGGVMIFCAILLLGVASLVVAVIGGFLMWAFGG